LDQLRVDNAADSFDGHWQTSFHNLITPQVAASDPWVEDILGKVIAYSEPPGYRIIFTDNHDKSGDLNQAQRLANRMVPTDPAGKVARKKTLLNAVLTLTAPGTPMLWMGQEFHAIGTFNDGARMNWREASAQHRIFRAHRDLIDLRESLPALQNSNLQDALTYYAWDETINTMVYRRKAASGNSADDVMVIMNFSNQPQNQVVFFPSPGPWYVRFNSDWSVYGSDFENSGPTSNLVQTTSAQGSYYASVALPPLGALVFSKSQGLPQTTVEDSNQNQIPDGWETMFGVASSSADDDSDGLSNSYEIQNGLDPLEKDIATVALDGVTNSLRAESNNPNVQFVFWATKATANLRFPTYTFLSNTIAGTTFTNPAGGYLRLSLNLTNLASNSATFFTPNTNTSVINMDRTNWARFYGVTNFSENPDGDAFSNLQEFARGSDPYTSNRAGIYLAGQDNDWNVSNRPMTFLGDRVWVCDFPAPKNASREFKLTDGRDWTNGVSWGDDQPDGLADQGSSRNISINFTRGGISRLQVDEGMMAYQVTYDATDVNGDGIQDAWVAFYGLTGSNGLATADPDGDGISNLAEFRRLSSPSVVDRMSVVGNRSPLAWSPDDTPLRMSWSDARQRWEWVGNFTAGALEFKFASGPGWGGSNYGSTSVALTGTSSTSVTNNASVNLAAGRHRFIFSETNGGYTVQSFPVSTEWREVNGLAAAGSWTNDTDKDGMMDLLEYALGGSPTNGADGRTLQTMATTNSGGINRLVLQWLQRTDGGSSLAITPESATDLTGVWGSVTASNAPNQAGVPANHQRREVSIPQDGSKKFLRLKVSGP
jgi:hypothetical protein